MLSGAAGDSVGQTVSLAQLPDPAQALDRKGLETLFLAGVTPAGVADRHGLTRRHVAGLAQSWGLDSRALRARPRSIAALRPDLAAEFIGTAARETRTHRADSLTLGSGRMCRWRCRECGHERTATVVNRAVHGSGFPPCAMARARLAALDERARSAPLAVVRPDIAPEFVQNLTVPTRDVHSTPTGSHDCVLWRCRYGHEWVSEARQRVKFRTNCPSCRPGFRSSRLEYEVAELFTAMTGLAVRVAYGEPQKDRADTERIDLYIGELDLLVDIDTARWHRDPEAVRRDTRKAERLATRRYVRLRSARLGPLDLPVGVACQQVLAGDDDKNPENWAGALLVVLKSIPDANVTTTHLTPAQREEALGRASRRWADLLRGTGRSTLDTQHPEIAAELVEVCGRPGLTAADIAPAGDDRVRWRCSTCGHEWTARTANRTLLGTGCPPCSYRAAGRLTARPAPGNSFADRHPGLAKHFIDNLTHPGIGPTQLRPNSRPMPVALPALWAAVGEHTARVEQAAGFGLSSVLWCSHRGRAAWQPTRDEVGVTGLTTHAGG